MNASTKIIHGNQQQQGLVERPLCKPCDYQSYIDRLEVILVKHKTQNDSVSVGALNWGQKTLRLARNSDFEVNEQILQRSLKRINTLLNKILVDSIDNSPLTNPLIDKDLYVWNKNHLLDVFNGDASVLEHVKPHTFAWQMSVWGNTIRVELQGPEITQGEAALQTSEEVYRSPISRAIGMLKQEREENQLLMQKLEELQEESRLALSKGAEEFRELISETKHLFQTGLTRLQDTHREERDAFRSELSRLINELHEEIERRVQSEKAQAGLEANVANLHAQISDLYNKLNNMGGKRKRCVIS